MSLNRKIIVDEVPSTLKPALSATSNEKPIIFVNGQGRIGKEFIWWEAARGNFSRIVINLGRQAGIGLDNYLQALTHDSTYGGLDQWLNGINRKHQVVGNADSGANTFTLNNVPVQLLTTARNPQDINWGAFGRGLAVDATGVFIDPTLMAGHQGGSVRGHLAAGASAVLVSSPFKIKDPALKMPYDATTAIFGINSDDVNINLTPIVSGASCTTTALAFMMNPLLAGYGADRIVAFNMVTIHAITASQPVLDLVPAAGSDKDLRKNRSGVGNALIITSTGAAKTLKLVMPALANTQFMANSVRTAAQKGSLIILTITLRDGEEYPHARTNKNITTKNIVSTDIQEMYIEESKRNEHLVYSALQNVTPDVMDYPAAVTIEGREIHTRHDPSSKTTMVTIYGWYDNELHSYANMFNRLAAQLANQLK